MLIRNPNSFETASYLPIFDVVSAFLSINAMSSIYELRFQEKSAFRDGKSYVLVIHSTGVFHLRKEITVFWLLIYCSLNFKN